MSMADSVHNSSLSTLGAVIRGNLRWSAPVAETPNLVEDVSAHDEDRVSRNQGQINAISPLRLSYVVDDAGVAVEEQPYPDVCTHPMFHGRDLNQ